SRSRTLDTLIFQTWDSFNRGLCKFTFTHSWRTRKLLSSRFHLCTGFSCETIKGIQSLLIGLFIYALMTINAFAIVPALRQTRVKYIADLGALAKTNPILDITFSITMFSYAGIPPLAGFCSKFYFFFAALQ
ncbi:hypothetical protein MKX01_013807, partial [Papaver californicum]